MCEAERTTRQRIADRLRTEPAQPATLAGEFEITTTVCSRESNDEQLLVAPPTCRDCGFLAFDDFVNQPSRCPDCKSEAVEEPTFVIE